MEVDSSFSESSEGVGKASPSHVILGYSNSGMRLSGGFMRSIPTLKIKMGRGASPESPFMVFGRLGSWNLVDLHPLFPPSHGKGSDAWKSLVVENALEGLLLTGSLCNEQIWQFNTRATDHVAGIPLFIWRGHVGPTLYSPFAHNK